MSCRLPCQVGSYCNSGGLRPYSVCMAAPAPHLGKTYWQPLLIEQLPGTAVPICPLTADPRLRCTPGNACYVAGLDGQYRCAPFYRPRPWQPGLPPPTYGWKYQEEIKMPEIFNVWERATKKCYTEIESDDPDALAPPGMKSCNRCGGTTSPSLSSRRKQKRQTKSK